MKMNMALCLFMVGLSTGDLDALSNQSENNTIVFPQLFNGNGLSIPKGLKGYYVCSRFHIIILLYNISLLSTVEALG